jgi:hypothetical protein
MKDKQRGESKPYASTYGQSLPSGI